MLRLLKNLLVVLCVALAGQQAAAFSLLGPSPASGASNPAVSWQTPALGYNPLNTEIGGPMNLGEEYRWNVPVVTYAFDESFLNFFGTKGVEAVDNAFAILNALPPVSKTSTSLAEFPLNTARVKFQASALRLLDVKTTTLQLMMEQLGLADPERFAFTLRDRRLITIGNTTTTNYFVIQRNFDPESFVPTNRINQTLYTYVIRDPIDPGPGFTVHADAVEQPVDPLNVNPSLAGFLGGLRLGDFGVFVTGLTRDDVGGLRYLYRTNNINMERLPAGTELAVTNTGATTQLTTFSLADLIENTTDTTNNANQVRALFPGLNLASTNAALTNIQVTNITTFFTNFPVASPPQPVFVTNVTSVILTNFNFTFDNVMTNTLFTNNTVVTQTVTVTISTNFTPGFGPFVTNVVGGTTVSNFLNGEVFVKPPGILDFQIVRPVLTNVIPNTNVISSVFGNLFAFTNTANMQALVTQDLTLLSQVSRGTFLDPNAIRALFPGILITTTNARLTNIVVTNFLGSNVFLQNTITTVFDYTFGNVVTNSFTTNCLVRTQAVEIVPNPFVGPGGSPTITNVLASGTFVSNFVCGDFYIVPTNLLGFDIIAKVFTNVVEITNQVVTNINAVFTNFATPTNLTTIDLAAFSQSAQTNPTATFLAQFPGLLVTSTNSFFTNQITTNVTGFFTNSPIDPAGAPPRLVLATNFTTNVVQNFRYTFGNVITNTLFTNGFVNNVLTEMLRDPLQPATSTNLITNVTVTTSFQPLLNGTIIIVPTNLFGFHIAATNLITVTANTNNLVTLVGTNNNIRFTNTLDRVTFSTNFFFTAFPIQFVPPSTNLGTGLGFRNEVIRFFTNCTFLVFPIELLTTPGSLGPGLGSRFEVATFFTNTTFEVNPVVFQSQGTGAPPALRRGVDKITFVNVTTNFDSLLGTTFTPVTNVFTNLVEVTGGSNLVQFARRIRNQPDIIFTAEDLGLFVGTGGPIPTRRTTANNWINNNAISGQASLAGPGVIPGPVNFAFNKIGPVILNRNPFFLDETTPLTLFFIWGSFDGTTNAPTAFPVGTSIQMLEQQVLGGP